MHGISLSRVMCVEGAVIQQVGEVQELVGHDIRLRSIRQLDVVVWGVAITWHRCHDAMGMWGLTVLGAWAGWLENHNVANRKLRVGVGVGWRGD